MKLQIADYISESITDGPGIRFTLFVQGCPHHCPGCHNPDTWDFAAGRQVDVEDIYQKIIGNPLIQAVTFSGGEPFCQETQLAYLASLIKKKGYEIAVYTGYLFEDLLQQQKSALLRYTDILVDGPFLMKERSMDLHFKGSKNQRVLNVRESLKKKRAVLTTDSAWISPKR